MSRVRDWLDSEEMAGLMSGEEYEKGIERFWDMVKETRFNVNFVDYLESIGYFYLPAAVKNHGNHPGGLLEHSMEVARNLDAITINMGLDWEKEDSALVVGLLHDLCKTDDYHFEVKRKETLNFGDEEFIAEQEWEPEYNWNQMFQGHGDKSIYLIHRFCMDNPRCFYLTMEEEMCIRFHMGAFVDKAEWKYYSEACKNNPNVLWTHTADMLASSKGI